MARVLASEEVPDDEDDEEYSVISRPITVINKSPANIHHKNVAKNGVSKK